LTQYYLLAYQNDLSHFASIICYHAGATGDVDTAVKMSLSAAHDHTRTGAYSDALDNVQRCVGLLENHAKTAEDRTLLVSCFMREAHLYLTMDKIDSALNSLSMSELVCMHQFNTPLPHAVAVEESGGGSSGGAAVVVAGDRGSRGGGGGGGRLLEKLFSSCFRTTKLKRMHKVIRRSARDIKKMKSMATPQGRKRHLTDDFGVLVAIMARLQRGYAMEGSVPDNGLLPSDADVQVQETLAHAKAAGLETKSKVGELAGVDGDSKWVSKVERDRKPVTRKSVVGLRGFTAETWSNPGGEEGLQSSSAARAVSASLDQSPPRATF
jgi:hypothetical protein